MGNLLKSITLGNLLPFTHFSSSFSLHLKSRGQRHLVARRQTWISGLRKAPPPLHLAGPMDLKIFRDQRAVGINNERGALSCTSKATSITCFPGKTHAKRRVPLNSECPSAKGACLQIPHSHCVVHVLSRSPLQPQPGITWGLKWVKVPCTHLPPLRQTVWRRNNWAPSLYELQLKRSQFPTEDQNPTQLSVQLPMQQQ